MACRSLGSWSALFVVPLLVGACRDDDPGGDGDTGGATAAIDTGSEGEVMLAEDVPVICEPGAKRCAGDFIETCAGTGLEWEGEPCESNTTCEPCDDNDFGCTEARCIGPCEAAQKNPSSAGCEFIANRQIHQREEFPDGLVVANPDEENTATVEFIQIDKGTDDEVVLDTVTLEPGDDFAWDMTNEFVAGNQSLLRSGGMYRIRSDYPIIAYQHAPRQNHVGNDSSLLLPDTVLGTLYVATTYSPHGAPGVPGYGQADGKGYPTYFEVISLQKDTWVEWTAPVPTHGDHEVGSQGSIPIGEAGVTTRKEDLNRYDTLRITASNLDESIAPDDRDLSGTVIRSNNPIWVVAGSRCSRVPVREFPPQGFCDPLQEVMIPVSRWGTEYVAAHPPLRGQTSNPDDGERHYWRIYGGRDGGTTFTTEPQVLDETSCAPPAIFEDGWCTLPERGSWIEVSVPFGDSFVVRGEAYNDTLMVVGYLQSRKKSNYNCSDEQADLWPEHCDAGGELVAESTTKGDPAMYQMVPTAQFLERYVFRTADGFDEDYVQVIRPQGSGNVFIDTGDQSVAINVWESVGAYEFANFDLTELEGGDLARTFTIESNDPFGIVQVGYATGAFDRHLAPTARGGAQIHDPCAGFDQPELVVKLDQFEGGAGAVTQSLSLGYVRIVELPLQPAGRSRRSPRSGLYPHVQAARRPGVLPRSTATFAGPAAATPSPLAQKPTLTSLVISKVSSGPRYMRLCSMPSRRPRSATRSAPTGQVRQIASKMAQPPITKRARSWPMLGIRARSR